jgi:hypothetical protein
MQVFAVDPADGRTQVMLMRALRTRVTTFLSLVLVLVLPSYCFAQAPLEPPQLPAQTSFYLIWRGTPKGEIRQTNALLSFWDDPDCTPLRSAIVDALMSDSNKQKDKPALTREELTQYASLLDNSFVLGYISRPDDLPTAKTPATGAPAWQGLFFVYDRTGKEALLSKAVLRMRASNSDIPKISEVTIAGVPALKIERKSGVNYWAETGKFAVSAQEKSVFELILNRLNGAGSGPSVVESAAYREAKPLLGGGILEFFFRVPDLKKLVTVDSGTTASAKQAATVVQALKLESIHSVAGHVTLEGAKTRLQGAVLGEPTPGSLFDIWSDGQAAPASMSLLSSGTVFYHESQINFPGIYSLLKNAFLQSGPSSAQFVAPIEAAAQTRLGMSIPDALGLTTGEIASLENSPTLDDTQQVRVLGIRNKPDALRLLRTLMSDQITSERNEGSITYVKISLHGGQSSAGVAQWNFYHLAMTPNLLLGASKSEPLHALLAQSVGNADPAPPKNFLAARSQFPEKVNGFSYFDAQKVDWPGMKARWLAEAKEAAANAKTSDAAASQNKLSDALDTMNPDVFPRHLHTMIGASWKDEKGVHFDEWMD